MKPLASTALLALLAVLLLSSSDARSQQASAFVPVTDGMLQAPSPNDWLMWRRTLNGWGYSPLEQINVSNVRQLRLVWTRGLAPGIQEGTPLVYNGVMYFPNPQNVIQAIDAKTGDLKWEYRRKLPEDLNKFYRAFSTNRNLAIYGNLIIGSGADTFVYALDALTGKLVWETQVADYHERPAQQTSGPIIANGKVISGRGCEPQGGPEACVITAHDAGTGREIWRTQTIPKPDEPGGDTWGDVPYSERTHVGTWMPPSYDPDLNLIYYGTSVTSPAPKYLLGGNDKKHLYHNSTLALNADSGKVVWYYQHVVDHWDLDHPFERLLVDTAVRPMASEVPWINPRLRLGERRKVLTGIPGKTGLVYTLDRQTGEFLWARPTVFQNVISRIDGATGEVVVNRDVVFTQPGDQHLVCPGSLGGKNPQAGAYSPLTNTMYMPLRNTCANSAAIFESLEANRAAKSLYGTKGTAQVTPNATEVGAVYAISVETGALVWKYEQRAGTSSVVTTGGGLLFVGDMNGRFGALDQKTGKLLWQVNLGAPVSGYPVSFAVEGHQYIAVSTGLGGSSTTGTNLLTPELRPSIANNLFVFALPD